MCIFQLSESEIQELETYADGSYKLRVVANDSRKLTDFPCFLLLFATWALVTYLGVTNIRRGDPYLILSGVNDQGQVCGHDSPVKSQPYFYSVLPSGAGVCVSSCPTESVSLTSTNSSDYYCLHDIVSAGFQTSDYIGSSCFLGGFFDVASGCGCMIKSATVTSPLKRCRFTETLVSNEFQTQKLTGMLWTFVSDIYISWPIIFLYGVGASILLSLAYFRIQQYLWIDEFFLYLNIVGLFGITGCLCFFAYKTFRLTTDFLFVKVIALVIAALALIVFSLIVTQIGKIHLSAKIISKSFKFMDEMTPAIFEAPFLKLLGLTLFLVRSHLD